MAKEEENWDSHPQSSSWHHWWRAARGKGGRELGQPSTVILLASLVASSLWKVFLLAVSLGGGGLVDNGEEERRLAMGLVIFMNE